MQDILSQKELFDLMRRLKQARKIIVCAHRGPDGDAVGASLAWAEYLRGLGKSVLILLPNPFPDFLKWLPGSEDILFFEHRRNTAPELLKKADLICCLDFNSLGRLQDMAPAVAAARAERLMIDHHENPDPALADFLISHPEMCATAEVVFRLICQLGGYDSMTPQAATALYCGMMTDTGGFTYNSTRPEIYEIISLLLKKGIDKDKIYRNVFNNYSPSRLQLQGYLLYKKLRFYAGNRASLFTLTREEMKEFHFIRGDAEGFVNMPLQVRGMRLSISLREDTERDTIRVSLRSVDDFPCNKMAEEFFNGGGHLNASGGELPFPMTEAVATVERAITAYEPLL